MASPANGPLCPENGIDIMTSYGFSLMGSFFSSALWGASSLQVFIYFMNSADSDPIAVNVLIACLWVLDTTNEILVLKSNWPVLILQYGRFAGLMEIQPELMHHVWVESIVVFVVQMYFIRRIYTFGKSTFRGKSMAITLFAIPLTLLATWRVVAVIVYEIYGYGKPLSVLSTKRSIGLGISIHATAAFIDAAVAICMLFLMYHTRQAALLSRSKRMISRAILMTICSGSLTAIFAIIVLVMVVHYPNTLHYTIFEYLLCTLYFSTLLANLNSRNFVRGGKEAHTFSSLQASTAPSRTRETLVLRGMGSEQAKSNTASELFIKVQRERNVQLDDRDTFDSKVSKALL